MKNISEGIASIDSFTGEKEFFEFNTWINVKTYTDTEPHRVLLIGTTPTQIAGALFKPIDTFNLIVMDPQECDSSRVHKKIHAFDIESIDAAAEYELNTQNTHPAFSSSADAEEEENIEA